MARLGLKLHEGTTLGADVELASSSARSEDSTWENPLGKRRVVRDHYRELTLLLRERSARDRTFQLVVRAFDDGVAFATCLLSRAGVRGFVLDQDLTEFAFPRTRPATPAKMRRGSVRRRNGSFAASSCPRSRPMRSRVCQCSSKFRPPGSRSPRPTCSIGPACGSAANRGTRKSRMKSTPRRTQPCFRRRNAIARRDARRKLARNSTAMGS